MKTDGAGERKLLTRGATERVDKPSWSPDGKWIACAYSSPQHRPATPATAFRTAVTPVEGGEPKIVFDSLLGSPENDFGWTADSRALTCFVTPGGVSNIWSQPIEGGRAEQLTDFKSGRIYSFDWSLDGKQLLVSRGALSSDAVIISDYK